VAVEAGVVAPRWSTRRAGMFWTMSRRPALRWLTVAWAGATAGDAMAVVAFSIIAYHAGGPGGVAGLVAAQMVPAAIVAPLLVAVTHRMRRERLGAVVDVSRVAMAAAAAVLTEASWGPHAALFALAAGLTIANAASNVARRAITPLLVAEPSELTAASVVASVVQAGAQTGGPALAALLLATSRTSVVLGAAAVAFAVAALAEWRLPSTAGIAVQPLPSEQPLRALAAGIRAVRSDAQLTVATALFCAKNVGRGAMLVLVVVVPLELLGLGRSGVGWMTALIGFGGVLGGVAAARLVGRARLLPAMAFGLVLWGLPLLALAGRPELSVAVAALLVIGVGNTITDVAGYSLIGRSARDDLLASVYGVHEALRAAAYTVGAGVAALVAELAGVRASLLCVGAVLALCAVAGELGRGRERTVIPAEDDVRALRATPLVGWLPPIALARIAATARPVDVAAGDLLIREGELGDCAYVIVQGELAVEQSGRVVRRVADEGVVGEIALICQMVRTATVRAISDCRVLEIEREEFLVAVGGNEAARLAAEELVEERLGPRVA
jgi:hypothetical protein